MIKVSVERKLNTSIERLWPLAADFSRSPSPRMTLAIIKQGDAADNGVGCERLVREGKFVYHEKLVAVEPFRSYTYVMLSGAPIRDYTGKVELAAQGDAAVIRWSMSCRPKIPGTGWYISRLNCKKYNHFIDELEKALAA